MSRLLKIVSDQLLQRATESRIKAGGGRDNQSLEIERFRLKMRNVLILQNGENTGINVES